MYGFQLLHDVPPTPLLLLAYLDRCCLGKTMGHIGRIPSVNLGNDDLYTENKVLRWDSNSVPLD